MTDMAALNFAREKLSHIKNKQSPWKVRNVSAYDNDITFSTKDGAINLIRSRLVSGNKRVCHLAKYNPKRIYDDDPYVNVERWELVEGIPKKVGVR